MTQTKIDEVFKYHSPTTDDITAYKAIRSDAKTLAETIVNNTPICADQTAALRKLREVVMTANASIALKGLI